MSDHTLRHGSWRGFLVSAATLLASLASLDRVQGQVTGQAALGQPFGVGRIEVQLDRRLPPEPLGLEGISVFAQNGRLLYPANDHRTVAPIVKELLGQVPLRGGPVRELAGGLVRDLLLEPPRKAQIFFLFTGTEPLEITVQSRGRTTLRLVPQNNPRMHQQLLRQWWDQYAASPGLLTKKPDYPPLVENYLTAMLASRLQLPLPERKTTMLQDRIPKELGMAMGTETVRIDLERERMLERTPEAEMADQPLPEPFEVAPLEVPEVKDVKVDPLAERVPAECFYVRFGSFSHFLWFQDALATWGGDLQNLVALRGLDSQTRRRFEEQLVLRSSALAKLLGDTVVADVAIIGDDLFLQEGGAYGLLFYARASALLANDFQGQRAERLKKNDGVKEEKVTIEGHEVSYLSTPDGSVRSYYASDGNYHFVTTSKTLVRRFLETASGRGSLGASPEFRNARSLMPQSRDDTVFIYLSDAFFRNLVSPHYQIELGRRVRSLADIELAQLALLASAAEGKPDDTLEALSQGGFLPPQFGRRPDGSQTILDKDGEVHDSLRGHRGQFVPIPDVEVTSVTASEAETYRQLGEFYQDNWGRLDPVIVGIKREDAGNRRDRVTIDVRMTPVAKANFAKLQQAVGTADEKQLAPIDGNIIAFELIRPDSRLFGGLQDLGMPFDLGSGGWLPTVALRNTLVGYLGTMGAQPQLLGFLEWRMNQPDVNGMSSTPAGIWRRQYGEFNIYSLQPELLMNVAPQLRFEPAKPAAQLRVRVADPTRSGVPPMLNKFGYLRTRETSLGNLRLLLQMTQQLHVPGPNAKTAAELLLNAKLICPLGGQYVYRETDGGGYWTSTVLESQSAGQDAVPAGFVTPPLSWFRGMALDAQVDPAAVSAHVDLQMQLPEKK
jgi:hypothetical protein